MSTDRRSPLYPQDASPKASAVDKKAGRTEMERDYDRLLFSTPVRRLADKTQVFPLEKLDSIRTRLTHSHEVSNLARSMGVRLAWEKTIDLTRAPQPERNLPALLAAVGLVHDLGNPPFGHQGEKAIQHWFASNPEVFKDAQCNGKELVQDFLKFEGNAQTFRIVTRLQQDHRRGLNLTYATLATLLKYTVPSYKADKQASRAGQKKPGYFESEREIVEEVWAKTGLTSQERHPLAYIVEACDDVAYTVIDAEDAVKKKLASYPDLADYLKTTGKDDPLTTDVLSTVNKKREQILREDSGDILSPSEINDMCMQYFRTYAIGAMLGEAYSGFTAHFSALEEHTFEGDILDCSRASTLRNNLKKFNGRVAFEHQTALEIELQGHQVIQDLMNRFWEAIRAINGSSVPSKQLTDPLSRYVYGRISENYRRVFEREERLPAWYRRAQLLSDMISGMTDGFAIQLHKELLAFS